METNKNHTPTPWVANNTSIVDHNNNTIGFMHFTPNKTNGFIGAKHNAEFIVTACNSYQSLIEQTAKLQADKDKLALMLERIHLMFLNRDMRETSAVIKQTLSECGY